ncbi:hypothetical protein NMY22_g10605 [Coprinellus aureogranulatus]|nr:hypothetical protein NMY22_g10605 [Coprinellus aureogranulatus]
MARQPELYYEQDEPSSSEEELEQLEEISEEEPDEGELPIPQTPSKRKGKARATEGEEEGQNIIVPTSFDAYFTYTASKVQTSGNVFSEAVLPLSKEEYAEGIKAASKRAVQLTPSILEGDQTKQLFSRFIFELKEGFNLLCYGFGSKRQILNQFAQETCSKHGHVVVANAFKPDFAIRDLLVRIASLPNVIKEPLGLYSAPDKGAEELVKALSKQKHHVYVVIHNIDAPSLRSARAKTALSVLASNPLVHIIASIDHLNAPLLWSSSEVFARKSFAEESSPASTRGFAWLWHDLTTLAPYDAELAFADRSSISGASTAARSRKGDANATNHTVMDETAAQHILASVTQKAKKLFALLGKRQLASIEQGTEENKTGSGSGGLREHGMAYGVLFAAARDDFVATNDQTLRALLGEFKDHRLILSEPNSAGVEVLWIPMRKERLQSVLNSLDAST